MKKIFLIIVAALIGGNGLLIGGNGLLTDGNVAQAVTFDASHRYSADFINCIYTLYGNTTQMDFNRFDVAADGTVLSRTDGNNKKPKLDYVPGLVAKAVIEAADYYQDSPASWSWFYSVADYGYNYQVPSFSGKSLDDLNACKMYFKLRDLAATPMRVGGMRKPFVSQHKGECDMAALQAACDSMLNRTLEGLKKVNQIAPDHAEKAARGGWWHKANYINQMWCDGQYMGPALLAQLITDGKTLSGDVDADWTFIAHQFEITWHYLWDKKQQLLFHAFSADACKKMGVNTTTHAETWADPKTKHSATYWGRAEGWYMMALVDVLEVMPKSHPEYATLQGYLEQVAKGLIRHQDKATKCWYQLLAYDDKLGATGIKTFEKDALTRAQKNENNVRKPLYYASAGAQAETTIFNYLESSCSFLYAAAFLKGARLGLFADNAAMQQVGKEAYEGAVTRFWQNGILIDCCASAGLGGGKDCEAYGSKYRSGSVAYYLQAHDVTRVTTYNEGKVVGAAIMAATEYERAFLPAIDFQQ